MKQAKGRRYQSPLVWTNFPELKELIYMSELLRNFWGRLKDKSIVLAELSLRDILCAYDIRQTKIL